MLSLQSPRALVALASLRINILFVRDKSLKHEERMQIARDFTEKAVKRYGKNIVTVAVAGPVAEDEDGDFSDLDLLIVTKKPLMQP